jgi:predicted Ser/Thr protein kinase
MITCPACSREISPTARVCPFCGRALTSAVTGASATVTGASLDVPLQESHLLLPADGRFLPGTVFAKRYRVVTLLGRGGMGEVYKADDLTLRQPVALKFLPDSIALSAPALVRFHSEARIARRVSHPNVCRVYDVGEVDGLHFLTMEFIDGEDLASLLRRIGRLPGDKAVEIARQISAGLAAAHDAGVIHRDLKPANIMIDGRGRARLTDFGVAAIAKEVQGAAVVGTPAYMAPEIVKGGEATTQSDIYSLGLVLYELFTGKRVFEAQSVADAVLVHSRGTTPTHPSSWVADLDPLVERAVLRCLENDPARRPVSAIQVAAALPGGDPLYAALAAGETPSPQMVAAAGGTDGVRPVVALLCLLVTILSLLFGAWRSERDFIASAVPLELPPDVLANKARELFNRFGYADAPVGTAYGFAYNEAYLEYERLSQHETPLWSRLSKGSPPAIVFWYRESPVPLVVEFEEQLGGGRRGLLGGGPPRLAMVSLANPSPFVPGMRHVLLDPRGGLLELRVVPSDFGLAGREPARHDADALLSAAGLDRGQLLVSEPTWTPPVPFDGRVAWIGTYPGRPDVPLQIEAAMYRDRPVAFQMFGPWNRIDTPAASVVLTLTERNPLRPAPVFMVLILVAAFMAWTNLRAGRGDVRGAFRLVLVCLALRLVGWTLSANHVTAGESVLFRMASSQGLIQAMSVYLLYLALEPYVRRRWPQTLISWSRALSGRLNDPLVGRDVAVGSVFAVLWFTFAVSMLWVTGTPSATKQLEAIAGVRQGLGLLLFEIDGALELSIVFCFSVLLFRVILRREWAAMIAAVALSGGPHLLRASADSLGTTGHIGLAITCTLAALLVIALTRFGLTAVASLWFVHRLLILFPTTLDTSTWYVGMSIFTLGTIVALTCYACLTAVGNNRLKTLLPAPG